MSDSESHGELESSSEDRPDEASVDATEDRTISWDSPADALVEHLQPVAQMDELVAKAVARNGDFLNDCRRIDKHYTTLQAQALDYKHHYPRGKVPGSEETATQLTKLVLRKWGTWQKRITKIDEMRTKQFYPLWNNRHAAGRVEKFVELIEIFNNNVQRAMDTDNLELAQLY
jgi:hypothetical protein